MWIRIKPSGRLLYKWELIFVIHKEWEFLHELSVCLLKKILPCVLGLAQLVYRKQRKGVIAEGRSYK
jgi:hypothetical protein